MIHYVPNPYGNSVTPRQYLTQWFLEPILLISEGETQHPQLDSIRASHASMPVILDLTHNPCIIEHQSIAADITLTGDYNFWSRPRPGVIFFPLFLWMFSLRSNQWWPGMVFDAGANKIQAAMCFNNTRIWHRQQLYQLLEPVRDRMVYTMSYTIDSAHAGSTIDVSARTYGQCAVNIVTETSMEVPFYSEKTAKPFVARQIPIIVGAPGANQMLAEWGLDMFEDIVPWREWDAILDHSLRLETLAQWLVVWLATTDVLALYQTLRPRVEQNKRRFHSEQFRDTIMRHMDSMGSK